MQPLQSVLCWIAVAFSFLLLTVCAGAADTLAPSSSQTCCAIVELRQYTVLPGKREVLVDLYDRHFIESQESAGIAVIGQFRVIDDPNRFFWLQGFDGMSARLASFKRFYSGVTWKSYRGTVNAVLLDNDNVLLLHPAQTGSGFARPSQPRPPLGTVRRGNGIAVATIYDLRDSTEQNFNDFFERTVRPVVESHGAKIIATLVTDNSPNNFPALPVRTNTNVFLWMACFADQQAYQSYLASLTADLKWAQVRGDFALAHMFIVPEVWQLEPTPRSSIQC